MNFKWSLVVFLLALITVTACNKSQAPKPTATHGTDVYIAGAVTANNGNTVAAYWKNGIITKLTDSSSNCTATAIAINGADVYVAGMRDASMYGSPVAVYWKDGIMTQLSNQVVDTYTTGIAVSGTDVYVSGFSTASGGSGNSTAIYWKNGVATALSDGSNSVRAFGIAVNGTDVYVCGANYYTPSSLIIPSSILWKNNVATQLNGGGQALCVVFSGNNVYVGGIVGGDAGSWLNGNGYGVDNIPGGYTMADGIAVSGTDVYLAGNYFLATVGNSQATYWKNGVATNLSNNVSNGNAIAVSGSDVYVVGYEAVQNFV